MNNLPGHCAAHGPYRGRCLGCAVEREWRSRAKVALFLGFVLFILALLAVAYH